MAGMGKFDWADPFLLDDQLSEDERMIRDSAKAYADDKLAPRIIDAFQHEHTDPAIFREMGALGLLGPTIPEEYGGDDPRFATNAGRLAFKDLLFAGIEAATSLVPKLELLARLEAVGVPAGPINTVAQAFDDPQVVARGMAIEVARPDGSVVPGLRTPIRFSDADLATGRAAPMLGSPT